MTRGKSGIFKPKVYKIQCINEEPTTFEQAMKNSNWRKAMEEEYKALMNNGTWTLMPLPKTKRR